MIVTIKFHFLKHNYFLKNVFQLNVVLPLLLLFIFPVWINYLTLEAFPAILMHLCTFGDYLVPLKFTLTLTLATLLSFPFMGRKGNIHFKRLFQGIFKFITFFWTSGGYNNIEKTDTTLCIVSSYNSSLLSVLVMLTEGLKLIREPKTISLPFFQTMVCHVMYPTESQVKSSSFL